MAAPRCLRSAFETCRSKRPSTFRYQPILQIRNYAYAKDILAGFPEVPGQPKTSEQQPTIQKSERKAQEPSNAQPVSGVQGVPSNAPQNTAADAGISRNGPASSPSNNKKQKSAQKSNASTSPSTSSSTSLTTRQPEPEQEDTLPPNVLATYLQPMKYPPTHRIPVGSLQLRSYSVRNLEFFADFAMRAAFYLKLPASGPVPLPRRIERWTVLKDVFINKKAQENFERITYKRLITVMDGEKSVVETWLAYLRKWQFYGVGMKANVWEFEGSDVTKKMDKTMADVEKELDEKLANFGFNNNVAKEKDLSKMLYKQRFSHQPGNPMSVLRKESTIADQRI